MIDQPTNPTTEVPEEPTPSSSRCSASRTLLSWLWELVETLIPALLIALAINFFVAQPTLVRGYSMEPTLHQEERLLVEKLSYRFHAPQRGDIVVLKVAQEPIPLVKRVIGLPGETVEIRQGKVYVNGQHLDEPYLGQTPYGNMPARQVPAGSVFVLGDNRNNSNDSRYFGVVPLDDIVGKAWLRYWPLDQIGLVR
jgi:signal peptidase I